MVSDAWMAGVAGWDKGPFAIPFHEGPAVPGFLAMVMAAQAIEEVEQGEMGLGVVKAMVVLKSIP